MPFRSMREHLPWQLSVSASILLLGYIQHALATSCEDVWWLPAKEIQVAGLGEYTCGEYIEMLQSIEGGSLSETDSRAKTALLSKSCEACWPWQRYTESGSSSGGRSAKRGVAVQNGKLTQAALDALGKIVSWGYTWDYQLGPPYDNGPSILQWESARIDFMPMVWGHGSVPLAKAAGLPYGRRALLGFNEPNFPTQANLLPHEAASYWPSVEALAANYSIDKIVAPAMNFHSNYHPITWLQHFFGNCTNCKIDAVSFHVFACYGNGLKYHLDLYRQFGKPMWITEMACADPYAEPERLTAAGQEMYMKEAIPLLESDPDVEMYAWFNYFAGEWKHPIDGVSGNAGLVYKNGSLSPLGILYDGFAHGNLTEINFTAPPHPNATENTTSTTRTTSFVVSTTAAVPDPTAAPLSTTLASTSGMMTAVATTTTTITTTTTTTTTTPTYPQQKTPIDICTASHRPRRVG
eukprot:TRINITY_DN4727_c1_g1_i3.p1 TRINITY_DN4727_c1_g1~~TRINITY_DN4727_c1_g1_i3.p1  ORF type:complete len:465 (-),score=77.12 TRINITY_DN4727_c1_g1_i3:95-1489(-)